MFTSVKSMGLYGLNAYPVDIEVSVGGGKMPHFEIVGLPDAAVRESRERIIAALRTLFIELPSRSITVNLAPANVRKVGTMYDLGILIGLLVCLGHIPPQPPERCFIGEASLTGQLRGVNGVLPMTLTAQQCGIGELFVPEENAAEASVTSVTVYSFSTLEQVMAHLGGKPCPSVPPYTPDLSAPHSYPDFADVKGQEAAKFGLEVAAAGGHNALMIGTPGSGKSMLAKRLPSILPTMNPQERLETTMIYSVAGMIDKTHPIQAERPFRAPHHTISGAGLIGGGTVPRPGEISLAHNGVLFLDELAEFDKRTLELLRQPLEDEEVVITRAAGTVRYPCSFMLIGAMNPCPCGYYGAPKKKCRCSEKQIRSYLGRISGPLLDRFDIHVEVQPLTFDQISDQTQAETSAEIRRRIEAARQMQLERFAGTNIFCNGQIPGGAVDTYCVMTDIARHLTHNVFDNLGLSARSYDRLLRVARTIADLQQSEVIEGEHIAAATQLRTLDRKYWGR